MRRGRHEIEMQWPDAARLGRLLGEQSANSQAFWELRRRKLASPKAREAMGIRKGSR